MNDMRIYVASLYDYNDGRLEGKWLDLSDYSDASELMDAIQEMLDELTEKYKSVDGEVREEFAVHDYEGIPSTLASEYMGEQDFQQLYDIAEVADDKGIPVEVLIERAGDTGSDDYQALADSLMFVVDGYDESDIVAEYESQLGDLGSDFWSNHIYIDDVTERVMYGEDVDRFREDILYENPDLDEDEAERQAEEMADEEAERREDLTTYLEDMGYGDSIPDFVSKDYEGAWKRSLSYDFDVINHDGQMYVFTNNYSLGGTILSGVIGAYIGYKIGRAKPQKKGFETEKRIGRKIKGAFSKKKMAKGGLLGASAQLEFIDEAYASYELQDELRKRLGLDENANSVGDNVVISFAYTDYGGDFLDKVAIAYFQENYPENTIVENAGYNGENAFVFGEPAQEWIDYTDDYPLGMKGLEDFYYEMLNESEEESFSYFLDDLERDFSFDKEEIMTWLIDNRSGYYSMTTQGLDISYSDLTDKLLEEGLISKDDEDEDDEDYATGGYVSKGEKVWNNMRGSEKYNFLNKNFTPKITPRDQETLSNKSFRFLPKNVKIAFESEYANKEFGKGGGIGFKGLSSKVAKRYEGKSVAPKYQSQYGTTYSKSEAKEVGDKVAGKVYWNQQGRKMAEGGNVNMGRSWHQDRRMHNKSERYEKPMNSRKRQFANGGGVEYVSWEITFFDRYDTKSFVLDVQGDFDNEQDAIDEVVREYDIYVDKNNYGQMYYNGNPVEVSDAKRVIEHRRFKKGGGVDLFSMSKTINDEGQISEMVIAENVSVDEFNNLFSDKGYRKVYDKSLVGFYFAKPNGDTIQLIPSFHKQGEILNYAKGGLVNSKYLNSLSVSEQQRILRNIANHYNLSIVDAEKEVSDEDAEMLYEYITDSALRMQVYNGMKNRRFAQGGGVNVGKYIITAYDGKSAEFSLNKKGLKAKNATDVAYFNLDDADKFIEKHKSKYLNVSKFLIRERTFNDDVADYDDFVDRETYLNLKQQGRIMAQGGGISGLDDLIRG